MGGVTRARAALLCPALLCPVLAAGCSVTTPFQRAPAELQVISAPETARVYVDDRFVATGQRLRARPHQLRPGVHFVTIEAPGYFPHDVRLELPSGRTTVRISLRAVPP